MLREKGSMVMTQSYQCLEKVLQELQQIHRVHVSLDRIEKKIDLGKLKFVEGATFDAYGQVYQACHPATRQDLLKDIQDWARQPDSRSIFWLQGMAGTGKSTISWTIADWLSSQHPKDAVNLGASFFFKRGEGDRGSAAFLFPTIIHQLVQKVSGLDKLVAQAAGCNPDICSKSLGEQFRVLIRQPLLQLVPVPSQPVYIVVVDALDECKTDEIDVVLRLWSEVPLLTDIQLRLFVTSRPDLPVQLGFSDLSADAHRDVVLHEVPRPVIEHDIFAYLKDAFTTIRKAFNRDPLCDQRLEEDWPGENVLQELTAMAVPLFIVAATIYRFVSDPNQDARDRLATILTSRRLGQMSQLAQTYLPVLEQLVPSKHNRHSADEERLWVEFRMIVGSIVTLAEPLSRAALATLLRFPAHTVALRLKLLFSVLQIPTDADVPVRPLHLSFGEFLTSSEVSDRPFAVNSTATHAMLFSKCIELLSRPNSEGLRENMCNLSYPGQPRQNVTRAQVTAYFPPEMQYACRYWIYHAQQSKSEAHDDDVIHTFLKRHYLHWLEAFSLMGCLSNAIDYVATLQSLVAREGSRHVTIFLEDARRFILANRYICEQAPLQLYSSALIFAPQRSIIREVCGKIPSWIQRAPITPDTWSAELQKLEGHSGSVTAVAFSRDGSQLASASADLTVRLWDAKTGQEVQELEGHSGSVTAVTFSCDGSQLASASLDRTIRLWDAKTGREVQKLEGHSDVVTAVAFSRDGSQLASASWDRTVRLWDAKTGQEVQKLEGHSDVVTAVAFSRDGSQLASASEDRTVRLWDAKTGQEVQKLEGHSGSVTAVTFSRDGSQLASASYDRTVRLWDAKTGQEVQKLEGQGRWVTAVAFSRDGSQLASASWDRTVRLWDAKTGQEIQKLEGHSDVVTAVAFSRDGSQLASASWDRTVRLWDAKTGQEVQKLEGHSDVVTAVAFSRDGSQLVSAYYDRTVRLWDAKTGQEIQKLEGHSDVVTAVAFSRDGSQLASASWDRTVRLWDAKTGREVQKLEGHSDVVTAVAFSRDGSQLASASWDGTIRLWDAKARQVVRVLEDNPKVREISFLNDGQSLLTNRGIIHIHATSSVSDAGHLTTSNNVVVNASWIECGGRRVLWLPHEYRHVSAVHDNLLAIGCRSGLVIFLQITQP